MQTSIHSERAAQALLHLTETDPALGALALWCRHRDTAEGATRTEDDTILYAAEFPLRPLPEQVGIAAHHVLHVALRHGPRSAQMAQRQCAGFAADLFNLAADGLVNDTLIAAGHAVPRPAVRASELLAGLGGAPADTTPAAVLAGWDVERLYLHLAVPGAGGQDRREAARRYAASKGFGEDLRAGGGDGVRRGDADGAEEWRGRVARAMAVGRAAGTGIGTLSGRLADLPRARVPWELRLRRLLARAVADRPRLSHRRPAGWWCAAEDDARRAGRPVPVFAPGRLRDSRRPRIVVGLDTSGSVDDGQLQLFAAETGGIARRSGAEVHLLEFDTEVHAARVLGPGDWPPACGNRPTRRGGGTSFAAVLARAAALSPSLVVVLTDLDGPAGPDPGVPVLWAVPVPPPVPPPFGRVLDIGG